MKLRTLVEAGLLVAATDCAFATVLTVFFFGSTFMRLWQGVASVPLGKAALEGGARTMWIGLGLHLCVAFWWSAVFLYGAMRLDVVRRLLVSRFGVLKVAALYGPLVWLAMTLVVIPLHETAADVRVAMVGPASRARAFRGVADRVDGAKGDRNNDDVRIVVVRPFWNSNTHYHRVVLASLPSGASRVLDVGCGDGLLSAELADAGVPQIVALDVDRPVLDRARRRHEGRGIEWVHGDVHTVAFEDESFDAVVSVAALHHMDAAPSLARFAQLVRPGGTVVVVGLAANAWYDIPAAAVAIVSREVLSLVHGRWEHSAPECWPPPLTYREMKALSARVLPGVRYRRHLLARYSLVWRKPRRSP